ncbi:hypothetical protein MGG_05712 [Pyricularia oryzae 70-15]|uniref:Nitrogen permease regulator 3 n=3 Tax=Pyricularia oryzae TaxID=318829 RepID=G4MPF6_PYRO7|nr:uncharacterized protein MGG_05712 [Pyricularia oryzae 70-15]EHA57999.1 hypothetical protein MGG_05712 [Pyricularia oryzae 70-15]ELQ37861.1 hypothetical protein OOU_Y34scaffold00567g8 [Pyricularia oryzae Y34]KAI7917938.1 hypothetical protein M9X92_007129 [Pyricularia oryzae]KAI7928100.1 hypothetical protein M0657_002783 [Pyricularia oryzae]
MSLPVLPNPSNFLGVALVINRTRDGSKIVFHYPPHVNTSPRCDHTAAAEGDSGEHTEHTHGWAYDYDEGGDLADRETPEPSGLETGASSSGQQYMSRNQDEHIITETGTQIVPWEHVAGFPTKDLESILTPSKAYHKKLFQISLDPIYCVSYPIHVPENGIWKKKKKKKDQEPKRKGSIISAGGIMVSATDEDGNELPPLNPDHIRPVIDTTRLSPHAQDGSGLDTAKNGDKEEEEQQDDKVSSMTMFNLVFFLNPKKSEVNELIDTMHTHIIRKVNKAYNYCQQRNDFVWKESKKILALKDKAREERRKMSSLWDEILRTSSLAASMQDVYDNISQNKIAVLQLETQDGMVTHSVQVPMPFHIADLPQQGDPDATGIWLTTANSFVRDDVDAADLGFLDKDFALLLMDDEKKIVSELQSDPDESTLAMIEYMRHSKPTLSFQQVAIQSKVLNLAQVRRFAHHFIFWRRAIAIPPLHARDVYILSPNCDLSKLPSASLDFSRAFPHCPPLPNILTDLSAAPRPYKFFCPNKTIRAEYMRILAWLMRGGWVTQLCTFAYVVVWPEIIYEVEHALEAEELTRAKSSQTAAAAAATSVPVEHDKDKLEKEKNRKTSTASIADGTEDGADDEVGSGSTLLSRTTTAASQQSDMSVASPTSAQSPSVASLAASSEKPPKPPPTAAQQAAEKARLGRLADRQARELAEKASAHARRPQPEQTQNPSANNAPHLMHLQPHIILDARTATGKESLYLSAIERRLRQKTTAAGSNGNLAATLEVPSGGGGGSTGHHHSSKGKGTAHKSHPEDDDEFRDRVADAWPVFCKYFNGHCALERIALQEEKKRREVWNLLIAMNEYLICVRHW